MKAGSSGKDAAWWQASTLSDPLPTTSVLYKSFKERDQCGHTVVVNHHSSLLGVAACPICDTPVAYVADGAVAKKDSGGSSVYFKYGKMVYRLSVPTRKQQEQLKPWWMFWKDDSTVTAQQRIMSVLGISHGMKVRTFPSESGLPLFS